MLGLRCCEQTFSSCSECGLLSSWGAWVSHCGGFFCGRAQTLDRRLQQLRCTGLVASRHVEFSQTRDQTHVLICIGRQIFNHWTTREVPSYFFLLISVETGGLALSSFCQRRRPFKRRYRTQNWTKPTTACSRNEDLQKTMSNTEKFKIWLLKQKDNSSVRNKAEGTSKEVNPKKKDQN